MRQINIHDETHTQLKIYSATSGRSMSDIADTAILEYIARKQKEEVKPPKR